MGKLVIYIFIFFSTLAFGNLFFDPPKGIKDPLSGTQTNNSDFEKYCGLLPNLNLPFKMHCNDDVSHPCIDIKNEYILKYKPNSANILGKIKINQNTYGIIYTYPSNDIFPVVQTYSWDGKPMAKLNLLTKNCGRENDLYSSSTFIIENHCKVTVIDSMLRYELDEENNIVGLLKSEIKQTHYSFSSNGQILKE